MRFSNIKSVLEDAFRKERIEMKGLDVRLTRELKRLAKEGFLEREDRGHAAGVYYHIPATKREMVAYRVFAREELRSKLRAMMKKLGYSRRILIFGFPLIFVYSALLRLREGKMDEFNFFLAQGKEMSRVAAEAFWEDLVEEYAPNSRISIDEISESLKDIEGTDGRKNLIVHLGITHDLIGKNMTGVIDRVVRDKTIGL